MALWIIARETQAARCRCACVWTDGHGYSRRVGIGGTRGCGVILRGCSETEEGKGRVWRVVALRSSGCVFFSFMNQTFKSGSNAQRSHPPWACSPYAGTQQDALCIPSTALYGRDRAPSTRSRALLLYRTTCSHTAGQRRVSGRTPRAVTVALALRYAGGARSRVGQTMS